MPASLPDAELLLAWRARRDEAAFREMCTRHTALVASTCRRLGSPDVDEATQAVFLVLAQRTDATDIRVLASWLTGTARRMVANQRLMAERRRRHEQEATVEHARQHPTAAADPVWDEARSHLDEALASLSASRREAVVRFFLEGRPQADIAAELGCTPNAVKVRVHEGMERLRAFFARRGIVLGAAALASGLASEITATEPALVASCTQAACAPATASTAAALASATTTTAIGATAAWTMLAAVLVAGGGIALWQASAAPPTARPIPTTRPAAIADAAKVLFAEDFEDDGFAARGWYGNLGFIRSSTEHAPGSWHAAEFRFERGSEIPLSGWPSRRLLTPTDAIQIAYWIKYSPDWTASDQSPLVVQFAVLTSQDGITESLSYNHLACIIGLNHAMPYVGIQDARNIDASRNGQDLVALTEDRAVGGGNGDSDGYGQGISYQRSDGTFWNEKQHVVTAAELSDSPGPNCKNTWHRIAVKLRLNRIVDGKGIPDGHLSYSVDGRVVLDRPGVMFRTARHPDMRFNQLVIAPWCSGFPQAQTFWIDDVTVTTEGGLASEARESQPPQ